MNLREIETFLILYETCSFTKTALKLGIAQPAVSRQINNLEEELGQTLFQRTKKSVKPTEEATELMLTFSPLISQMKESWSGLKENRKDLSGLIRVGSINEPGERWIYPIIEKFKKLHPEVEFHLELKHSAQIISDIKNGLLDFGLVFDIPNPQGLRVYSTLNDSSVLVARPQVDFDPTHLDQYQYISYRRDDALLRQFMEKAFGKKRMKDLKISLSVNSHDLMKRYLQTEKAIAIMPLSAVQEELKAKKLKLLSEKRIDYHIQLVTTDQKFVEERKEVFKSFLLKELKAKT